jgi:GNAT superfamily N-acetyltransferase
VVELTWIDSGNPDRRDVAGAVAVLEASRALDRPKALGRTADGFVAWLRHGWDGDPSLTAVARDSRGRVTGVLEVMLPHWDNTHLGHVTVTVDPLVRRRGLGRSLFEAGVQSVRDDGRTLVTSDSLDDPAGVGFLKAMGLDPASTDVIRRQDLYALDRARLDREYAAAERHAEGYELIRMPGATPEDMMAEVVRMTAAINDRPTDDLDVEDEVFSPERIRAFEAAQFAQGLRMYRVAARERVTGALAGHTVVAVPGAQPWHGWQYDTSVLRTHRGHRLGLLVKIAMLRWLGEEEPQLRAIDTGNAATNDRMIRINEMLGYRVIDKAIEWQRRL